MQIQRSVSPINNDKKPNRWVDDWLLRLAYLSQVGLLFLAIAGLFYTVIPLYQKAALDEAIARDEKELKLLQGEISSEYTQIRFFTINNYVLRFGAECTGLLIKLEPPLPLGAPIPQGPPQEIKVLQINVSECLRRGLNSDGDMRKLHQNDLDLFAKRVAEIGGAIDASRTTALQEFLAHPNLFFPHVETDAQLNIVSKYGDDARKSIFSLKEVDWSKSVPIENDR